MEADWHWICKREDKLQMRTRVKRKKYLKKLKLKKEGKKNELWRIWWAICTTRIKREIK